MQLIRRPGTIRFWLGWLITACVLPVWIATGLVIAISYHNQRAAVARETIESPRALMQAVDWEMVSVRDSLLTLALSVPDTVGNLREFDELARGFVDRLHIRNVFLLDPTGQQLVNTILPFGEPLPRVDPNQPQVKLMEMFETGQPVITDLFIGPLTKTPLLALGVPVLVHGKVAYGLAIGIAPQRIDAVLRHQQLPSDWVTAVVDKSGTIVARSRAADQYVGRKAAPSLLRNLREIGTGTAELTTLEGIPVLSSFSRSAETGWGVVIGIPTATLMAEVWQTLWLSVASAFGLLLLALWLARILWMRIAEQIRALVPSALALGSGEPITIIPGRIEEVNEVGHALARALYLLNERLIARDKAEIAERQMAQAKFQAEQAAEYEMRERLATEAVNAKLNTLAQHLREARDQADQANHAKTRFLAGMSHELRTPLNGILGYTQLLRMEGGLNPTQSSRVDSMLSAGKHLLEMITCILDLSEIEAEHVTLRPVVADIRAIAAAALDFVRPTAEAKALALDFDVAPGAPKELVVDAVRLRQVLLNLVGNAVKFTSHGAVTLRLRQLADRPAVRIEVADTGQGIPAEQRQRLFQDFERLDTEATAKVEGAGLGLALSARLTTLMGGRLGHEDNPGGGSVFWLELPLSSAPSGPASG